MIRLVDIIKEGKVLSVFDFDDTIAKSDAWVYVTRKGRTIKKLNPAEFAVYKPKPGETFDFREFDRPLRNPRLIKLNADLLRQQIDKAKRAARGTRKVTILTARRLGTPVTSFLKTVGIDAYVVPLGSSNPQHKADWIEKQIKKGYDTIYFMDDSNKNIAAVKNMLNRYPNVQSITKLIKEGISKSGIQEIVDKVYPQIVKNLGPARRGTPKVEMHNNIYVRVSGIEGAEGEANPYAEYDWKKNKIYLYTPKMVNETEIIKALLHEYTHATQDPKKMKEYRKLGYEKNPYEIAATNAEKRWRDYI